MNTTHNETELGKLADELTWAASMVTHTKLDPQDMAALLRRAAAALLSSDAKPVQDGANVQTLKGNAWKAWCNTGRKEPSLPGALTNFDAGFMAAMLAADKPAEGGGEAVAYALRFPSDSRLCLSTVFDTETEAREYVETHVISATDIVPLYTKPQADKVGGEAVAWTTDFDLDGVKTGFTKTLVCRAMSVEPAFPKHQVVYVYTHPQPQPSALPDDVVKGAAIDAIKELLMVHEDRPSDLARKIAEQILDAAIDAAMLKEGK